MILITLITLIIPIILITLITPITGGMLASSPRAAAWVRDLRAPRGAPAPAWMIRVMRVVRVIRVI